MPRRIAPFTAFIAVALLIGGVAYAVTPDPATTTASTVTSTTIPDDDGPTTTDTTLSITETTIVETTSTTVGTSSTTPAQTPTTTLHTTTSTVGSAAAAETRSFEAPGIGTLTVSFDGASLTLVGVKAAEGWTHTIDEITARNIEIDFWREGVRHRAKVEIEHGDLRFEHFEK